MLQNISLNELLTFQSSNDPAVIADYMSSTNEWVTNHWDFSNPNDSYDWYKAEEGEEFVPDTKDQFHYTYTQGFAPTVMYVTEDRSSFNAIYGEVIASSMTQIESRNVPEMINYSVYASVDQVIQVYEPFIPNDKGRLNYVFMVFKKSDYDKGFRIK